MKGGFAFFGQWQVFWCFPLEQPQVKCFAHGNFNKAVKLLIYRHYQQIGYIDMSSVYLLSLISGDIIKGYSITCFL